MIRTLTFAAFAALATVVASTADAQVASTPRTQDTPAVSIGDEYFAMKAYSEGTAQVALCRLAVERATDPELKKFAEEMIRDHINCDNKIIELARTKGIPLPTTLEAVCATMINRIGRLSGSDFDRAFMKAQMCGHMAALHLYGRQSHKGEDADLKAFASEALPKLEAHTKQAFELAGEKDEYQKFEKVRDFAKQVWSGKDTTQR
jgi:putative membrane protein